MGPQQGAEEKSQHRTSVCPRAAARGAQTKPRATRPEQSGQGQGKLPGGDLMGGGVVGGCRHEGQEQGSCAK